MRFGFPFLGKESIQPLLDLAPIAGIFGTIQLVERLEKLSLIHIQAEINRGSVKLVRAQVGLGLAENSRKICFLNTAGRCQFSERVGFRIHSFPEFEMGLQLSL